MRTLISLAIRNVVRHKARSLITVGAILFGVLLSVFLGATVEGLRASLVNDVVTARVGAIQVHRTGYFKASNSQPLKLDMEQGGALEAKIRSVPGVSGVTGRITFSGMISNGSNGTVFIGQAIDPAHEYEVLPNAAKEVKGQPVKADNATGAVVGAELANALGVKVGSNLTLQASSQQGKENALDFDVAGTVNNANMMESKRMVYVPLAFAQSLLGMKGRVTELAIGVKDHRQIDAVAVQLRNTLGPDYEVQTWSELRPSVSSVIHIQQIIFVSISFIFLIIAVIGVVNTLLMAVMERIREIGTMMAVGVRRGKIASLFLLEAAAQAILGGAIGVAGAFGLCSLISSRGGIPLESGEVTIQIFPTMQASSVAVVVLVATLGAVVGALYPAVRASRLRPVEALRSV